MVVGLTGGIGSGKSTVLEHFNSIGDIAVYIADVEAKNLMNSSSIIKDKIIVHFGKESYVDNQLNRKYLADKVFGNKTELEKLNSIVHPEVYRHLKLFIENNADKDYVLYENAILFENKSDLYCDFIITVFTDEAVRIDRVMKRDQVSKAEVESRIQHQMSDQKKILLSNYVIDNNGLLPLESQIVKIHNILTKKKPLI